MRCPSCLQEVGEVYPIDIDLRDKLSKMQVSFSVSDEICKTCLIEMRRNTLGSGGVLMAEEKARDDRKKKMWVSRVAIVKQASSLMQNKMYNDAAVSYEKYLRLLELVFNTKQGQLTPESLKESAKTAELTVIVGVYWDLLKIYDSSPKFAERQRHAANQLAKFINYTPVYPDIMKKANQFLRSAKNPDAVKLFINQARKKRSRCFIATAAFESNFAPEVQRLRLFRDVHLKTTPFGRKFVYFYYMISPNIAKVLDKNKWLRAPIREILRLILKFI